MAKTSGTDPQALSLPNGGGAVQGLGATFETDLNTGTGAYSIPIDLPAGPNGIMPTVTLRYASSAGNGPFGLGWSLGAVTIARKNDDRIPDYAPGDDSFVLVGVEDLIPIGGGAYRPRVDTMNWRMLRSGDGWQLTDTRGLKHSLGASTASRVETVEGGLTKTALWLLDTMTDVSGNMVRYFYIADGAQRYLDHIDWGTYSLRFFYEARPDVISTGRYGFWLATAQRCNRIELHVPSLSPSLVRSWTLEYTAAPGSGHSLLSGVILRGHAADGTTLANPPLALAYSAAASATLSRFAGPAPGFGPARFEAGHTELLDWDGDGLPDAIEIDQGRLRIWPNRGRGRWDTPHMVGQVPAPLSFDEPGVAFADMLGSGTADLIVSDRPLSGFYPHVPGGGFERLVSWREVPAHSLSDGDARLVDLDGDDIVDLLVTGADFFSLYYRDPAGGWRLVPQTIPRAEAPPVSFSDPHVSLADMNGDGVQDLVRIDGGGVTWWPYLGHGRWLAGLRMANAPILPRQYDPRRMQLADVDGDGCADLVYVGPQSVTVWLNQGGQRLADPIEIPFTPFALPGQFRLADMKGSGGVGIVFSSVAEGPRRADYLYLDLTGGQKPYLLTGIVNGLGGRIDITYRPSTEFAIDAAEAGTPWRTFHPFPVQCVAQVQATDLVTGVVATTQNRYHEARYDGTTRRFLGFATVDVDTVGDATVPTLRTRNVYHLGLDPADPNRKLLPDEALRLSAFRRRLLRTEMYGVDGSADQGNPYQVVTHEYDVTIIAGTDGQSVLVPFERRTFEQQFDRGTTPFAQREIQYLDLDEFGNVQHQQTRTWRPGAPQDDELIVTEATFAKNLTDYLVSFPARLTQSDLAGKVFAVQITYYDGPDFQGLAEGQIGAGNVTRQELLAISDDLATEVYGAAQPDWASLGYHRRAGETGWWIDKIRYGRPDPQTLIVRGARGFDTTMKLDASRQFPAMLTDPTGAAMTGTIDQRAFQMGTLTDANGQVTRDSFDPLGRVIAVVKPGDSDALPSCAYEYRSGQLPVCIVSHERINSGTAPTQDSFHYANGRGDVLQSIVPGEGDAGRRFIVQETREYNARSLMAARALPYYADSADYAPAPAAQPRLRMRFDALGRVIEQIGPDGSRATHDYSPGRVVTLDDASRVLVPQRTLTKYIDGLKRTIRLENQLADHVAVATYEYDAIGRLTRYTAANGAVTSTTFDGLGRILVEQNPDSGRTVFVFDAAGNQVARTNAAGQTMRHTVDELDRLTVVKDDAAPDNEVFYTYLKPSDPAPPDGAQNRIGRVWKIADRLGTLEFTYDALGRVTRQARSVTSLAQTFQTDWVYDALGRQTRITMPEPTPGAGRRVVDFVLNARGLPVQSPGFVKSADYDVQGNLRSAQYQNGTQNLADFDLVSGRPQRQRLLAPDGVTALRDQTLSFDSSGNLSRIDSPIVVEAGAFQYDEWHHLTDATYGSGEHFTYQYADGGNITNVGGLGALTYAGPQSAAVVAAGNNAYAYDAGGRMSKGPIGQFRFDAFDSLVHIDRTNGETVDYVYDFRGQRVGKKTSTGTNIIVADQCLEFHGGTAVLWIPFGTRRVMAITPAAGLFVHADWLGAYTLFTALDGSLARRLAFGPYGTLRFDSAPPAASAPDLAGFAGHPSDLEAGLICLGRRFLDPTTGRFLSPDMVIGDLYRFDAWNRYQYAYGNPLRYIDPTGYFSWGDFFAIVAVVLVVAALVVAGFFTAGATWAIAGVVINVSAALIGTAVGVAAGAIIGGYAAYKAGGDIWKGILFGGLVGGVAAFAGGVLGAIAGSAVGGLFGSGSLISMLAAGGVGGAVQGAIAGIGTGAAIGFGGGKGNAALMWQYMWRGAVQGAITGFIVGLASAYIFATPNASLQVGLGKITGASATDVSTYDNAASLAESVTRDAAEGTAKHGWGLFVGIGSATQTPALTLSIPIGWVPNVMFNYAGIATLVNVGVTLDKYSASYGFDFQFLLLLSVIPYFVGTFFDIWDWQDWGHIHEGLRNGLSTYGLPNSA